MVFRHIGKGFSLSLGQRLAMRMILRYNKSEEGYGRNPEQGRLRDGEQETAGGD